MSEYNYVSVEDYKELCGLIRSNMSEFLEQVTALEDEIYDDMY